MNLKITLTAAVLALSTNGALADFVAGRDAYLEGDYQRAYREFALASKEDDAKSRIGLGLLYTWGQGTPRDYIEAYTWFHVAATQDGSVHPVVRVLARTNRNYLGKQMSRNAVEEALSKAQAVFITRIGISDDFPEDVFIPKVSESIRNVSRSPSPSISRGAE